MENFMNKDVLIEMQAGVDATLFHSKLYETNPEVSKNFSNMIDDKRTYYYSTSMKDIDFDSEVKELTAIKEAINDFVTQSKMTSEKLKG